MDITLYDTASRSRKVLTPRDPGRVGMYVCGPTVYDRAHIGNARPVVVFDVLYRLLRHVYGDSAVTYVRNFTDVDDKINARAAETGRTIRDITDETIGWYLGDMDALGALRPTHMPRATDYVSAPDQPADMVRMIAALIARGHAYEAEGHVLFDVPSHPGYGALSRRPLDEMQAGARVDVAPYKRSDMDFVLWKPSAPGLPGWDSPWGWGRPGWHIECSAMARALLGDQFDIHGGGIDLVFPHHENELAQSCCANGTPDMAGIWMHNGYLMVEGAKMSKSLGNFTTVADLRAQGVPGEVIRLVLLSSDYRQPLDWSEKKITEATNTLRGWAEVAVDSDVNSPDEEFLDELSDDLNFPGAISCLHRFRKTDRRDALVGSASLLGFELNKIKNFDWIKPNKFFSGNSFAPEAGIDYLPSVYVTYWGAPGEELLESARKIVQVWLDMRKEQNWTDADDLKKKASALGIDLSATRSPNGVNGGNASIRGNPILSEIKGLLR